MDEFDHNSRMDDQRDENRCRDVIRDLNGCSSEYLNGMSCNALREWLLGLSDLGSHSVAVANTIHREMVDGVTFSKMTWEDFTDIGISENLSHILASFKHSHCLITQSVVREGENFQSIKPAAVSGDSSTCYGHLLTLGYKSYRVTKGAAPIPVGTANDIFDLSPRDFLRDDNTVQHSSPSGIKIFQVGRCDEGFNDWVVQGVLVDDTRQNSSPGSVSRYMCRIACDEFPPYRVRVYASGEAADHTQSVEVINHEGVVMSASNPQWVSSDGQRDAFTTHGVRLYSPSRNTWAEVSVRGRMFAPFRSATAGGMQQMKGMVNELEHGSILDLGGVLLMYQSPPNRIKRAWACRDDTSSRILQSMNQLRPQCPVLMDTISFPSAVSPKLKVQRLWQQRRECHHRPYRSRSSPVGGMHRSHSDPLPYVFSACGHVHGYSPELDGRPCPLCRMSGPYVPLLLAAESKICNKWPTHVFNPCGHAASLDVCLQWASTPLPDICLRKFSEDNLSPCCPFCLTKLEMREEYGGAFNRLVIQYEDCDSVDMMISDVETISSLSGETFSTLGREDSVEDSFCVSHSSAGKTCSTDEECW